MIDVPIVSPTTGLIGYPIPDLQGVKLQCLYDKALRFGGLIEVAGSLIEQCNGRWRVFGLSLDLESQNAGRQMGWPTSKPPMWRTQMPKSQQNNWAQYRPEQTQGGAGEIGAIVSASSRASKP